MHLSTRYRGLTEVLIIGWLAAMAIVAHTHVDGLRQANAEEPTEWIAKRIAELKRDVLFANHTFHIVPHSKLSTSLSRLYALHQTQTVSANQGQLDGLFVEEGRVQVVIELDPNAADTAVFRKDAFRSQIEQCALSVIALGGNVDTYYAHLLQAWLPIEALEQIAALSFVHRIRLPLRPVPSSVASTCEQIDMMTPGVQLIDAADWHQAGILGCRGDCQANVEPIQIRVIDVSEEHACLVTEIVERMAPEAEVQFSLIETDVELNDVVDALIAEGIDIIVMSLVFGYRSGPLDGQTGPVHAAVQQAMDHGITWVNSAGNHAESHWFGAYRESGYGIHEFPNSRISWRLGENQVIESHLFKPINFRNDPFIGCSEGEQCTVEMLWDDLWDTRQNDYALCVIRGTVLADMSIELDFRLSSDGTSLCSQREDDHPVITHHFHREPESIYVLMVMRQSGDGGNIFHLMALNADRLDQATPEMSILIPADNPRIIAVGASPLDHYGMVEPFSSRGPNARYERRPDLIAPNRVPMGDGTAFVGTSAAAPYVAGATALVLQVMHQENLDITPATIKTFLQDRAADVGELGPDHTSGYGRLQLGAPESAAMDLNVLAMSSRP